MSICRNCKGVEVIENKTWKYGKKDCPLSLLPNTIDDVKEKCANEKVIALNEPGIV